MPQLPSGRHVGVKFDERFSDALENPQRNHDAIWMFMPINAAEDMFPWVRILWLLPEESPSNPLTDTMRGSLPLPCPLVESESGFRLHQADTMMASWTEEDRVAFNAFITERVIPLMLAPMLEIIKRWKEWVPTTEDAMMQMMYLWWTNGCHPAQEEQWQCDDPVEIDTYDIISALDQFMRLTKADEPGGRALNRCIGLWIFIDNLHKQLPEMLERETDNIKDQAAIWRQQALFDNLPAAEIKKLQQQTIREAVLFWDGFTDEELRERDLYAWKVIQRVVVSEEANPVFAEAANLVEQHH
jgi:hypothetical protein